MLVAGEKGCSSSPAHCCCSAPCGGSACTSRARLHLAADPARPPPGQTPAGRVPRHSARAPAAGQPGRACLPPQMQEAFCHAGGRPRVPAAQEPDAAQNRRLSQPKVCISGSWACHTGSWSRSAPSPKKCSACCATRCATWAMLRGLLNGPGARALALRLAEEGRAAQTAGGSLLLRHLTSAPECAGRVRLRSGRLTSRAVLLPCQASTEPQHWPRRRQLTGACRPWQQPEASQVLACALGRPPWACRSALGRCAACAQAGAPLPPLPSMRSSLSGQLWPTHRHAPGQPASHARAGEGAAEHRRTRRLQLQASPRAWMQARAGPWPGGWAAVLPGWPAWWCWAA